MLAVETGMGKGPSERISYRTFDTSPPISRVGILNEFSIVGFGTEMKQIENHSPRFCDLYKSPANLRGPKNICLCLSRWKF